MTPRKAAPDLQYVKEHFSYDAVTGTLSRIKSKSANAKLGPITHTFRTGHLYCKVREEWHAVHQLVWLIAYGTWPKDQIDHINGVKSDNRLCNLREADNAQNQWNQRRRKNTSGFKGVSASQNGRWQARLRHFGKRIHLGTFDTPAEAHQAYWAEARKRFGEFANPGQSSGEK